MSIDESNSDEDYSQDEISDSDYSDDEEDTKIAKKKKKITLNIPELEDFKFAIQFPQWSIHSSPEYFQLLKQCFEEKLANEMTTVGTLKKQKQIQMIENDNNDTLRRGKRVIKSRFVQVDGNYVLKSNNYSLEEGEPSVWNSEANRLIKPKKPPSAKNLFVTSYQQREIKLLPDSKKQKLNDSLTMSSSTTLASSETETEMNGLSKMHLKLKMINNVWNHLNDKELAIYENKAKELKLKYDKEIEEWEKAHERLATEKYKQNNEILTIQNNENRENLMKVNETSNISKGTVSDQIQYIVQNNGENGINIAEIFQALSKTNTRPQLGAFLRPMSVLLKNGLIRRLPVNLDKDEEFFNILNERFHSDNTTKKPYFSLSNQFISKKDLSIKKQYFFNEFEEKCINLQTRKISTQMIYRLWQEIKLRKLILNELIFINNEEKSMECFSTIDLPEKKMNISEISNLKTNLEINGKISLEMLNQRLNNNETYCFHINLKTNKFELPLNWSEIKSTIHPPKIINPKNKKQKINKTIVSSRIKTKTVYKRYTGEVVNSLIKVEEFEFKTAMKENRIWLGQFNSKGIWEISLPALQKALPYLVCSLVASGHVCWVSDQLFPAHLHCIGPKFPRIENPMDVQRKVHNDLLFAKHAKNIVMASKYVSAHLDEVGPFLDKKVVRILLKREETSSKKRSAAAAKEHDDETLTSITLSKFHHQKGFKALSANEKDLVQQAIQQQELERQVDYASLPTMDVNAPLLPQPDQIVGEMRDYQLKGFSFLTNCYQHGVNCILADEMGLGKTIQTIAYLTTITYGNESMKSEKGPHLVVVPLSVLTSWMLELKRFSPQLRVVRMHSGDVKERDRIMKEVLSDVSAYDVVVTTYEMIVSPSSKLCFTRHWWRSIVLDEGHKIKNEETNVSIAARKIHATHRVILSGTPLQNNLHELWAMLNYLFPEIFVSSEPFDECFDLTLGNVDNDMLDKAYYLMKLFSLRRIKSEVEVSLPPKNELKILVPLSEYQLHFYRSFLMKDFDILKSTLTNVTKNDEEEEEEGGGGGMVVVDHDGEGGEEDLQSEWKRLQCLMTQLRKTCNHPYLFPGGDPNPENIDEGIVEASNKMALLDRLLPKLKQKGHRVLIFSQFTMMLDILDDYCSLRDYNYTRLDGSMNRVQRAIDVRTFNQDGSELFIFLMSTRAGGLGINLQSADTVILFDSDWNPQVDLQAIGRVHRIGQKKPVHIYRLITEGTIEERIYDRAQKKLFLSEMVNRDASASLQNQEKLGKKELLDMISIGADTIFKTAGKLPSDKEIDAMIDRSENMTWKNNKTNSSSSSSSSSLSSSSSSLSVSSSSTDISVGDDSCPNESGFSSAVGTSIDFTVAQSLRHFEGIEYATPKSTEEIAQSFHAKRQVKSRFIKLGQDHVLKENNYSVIGDSYVFENDDDNNNKKTINKINFERKTSSRQVAGRDYEHENTCLYCWEGGDLICCDQCPAVYHPKCLGYNDEDLENLPNMWGCPHHKCLECGRGAQAAGGLIFRCEICPEAYCEDHLPIDAEIVGGCARFEKLGMKKPSQACYIHCSKDCHDWAKEYLD